MSYGWVSLVLSCTSHYDGSAAPFSCTYAPQNRGYWPLSIESESQRDNCNSQVRNAHVPVENMICKNDIMLSGHGIYWISLNETGTGWSSPETQ